MRGEPIRGRIGQPSVPMSINPEARFYVGLKTGRRSFDLVVMNFAGTVLSRELCLHDFPTPRATVAFAERAADDLLNPAAYVGAVLGHAVAEARP